MSNPNTIRIFFLHMPGCEACEAAMPAIRELAREAKRGVVTFHGLGDGDLNRHLSIKVIFVDLLRYQWPDRAYRMQGTPCYIVHVPKKRVAIREGAIETKQELKKWVNSVITPAPEPRPALPVGR